MYIDLNCAYKLVWVCARERKKDKNTIKNKTARRRERESERERKEKRKKRGWLRYTLCNGPHTQSSIQNNWQWYFNW